MRRNALAAAGVPTLIAEVERLQGELVGAELWRDTYKQDRDGLRAQRQAALNLHVKHVEEGWLDRCEHCERLWPCETAAALGATE